MSFDQERIAAKQRRVDELGQWGLQRPDTDDEDDTSEWAACDRCAAEAVIAPWPAEGPTESLVCGRCHRDLDEEATR